MKIGVLILEGPYQHQAADTAYHFGFTCGGHENRLRLEGPAEHRIKDGHKNEKYGYFTRCNEAEHVVRCTGKFFMEPGKPTDTGYSERQQYKRQHDCQDTLKEICQKRCHQATGDTVDKEKSSHAEYRDRI